MLKIAFILCINFYSVVGYSLLLVNILLVLPLSIAVSSLIFNKIDKFFVDKAKLIFQSEVKL